jgi:undecaprenyl pyrophosphate phosphatase UppP
VSSTGHLLLLEHFFGFDDDAFGKTFVVLIQLGAILAILSIYFQRLWQIALGALTDPAPRRFIIGVLIAFLPAAIIGALLHSFIKGVLFNPWIVCVSLIVGGGVLLWVDRLQLRPVHPRRDRVSAADLSLDRALPMPRDDPGRVALRRHRSCRRCCSAPTSARRRSSRSSSRCPPWRARSPTTC